MIPTKQLYPSIQYNRKKGKAGNNNNPFFDLTKVWKEKIYCLLIFSMNTFDTSKL